MKKHLIVLIGIVLVVNNSFANEFSCEYIGYGIEERKVEHICLIAKKNMLFASTDNSIYEYDRQAKKWQRILYLEKSNERINALLCAPEESDSLYIATNFGLYVYKGPKGIKRIFKSWRNCKDVKCIAISSEIPGFICIGTSRGFFISEDYGASWTIVGFFKNKSISSTVITDRHIYVATSNKVYKGKIGQNSWKKIFLVPELHNENEEEQIFRINRIVVDLDDKSLYLATEKGIYVSKDDGKSWEHLSQKGLLSKDINDIVFYKDYIITAAGKGVFISKRNQIEWRQIFGNLMYDTEELALNRNEGILYAATEKGAYKQTLNYMDRHSDNKQPKKNSFFDVIKLQIEKEPTIRQIQEAAIEYGEISNDKIAWMRKSAKNKAWLPDLSIGFDGDINRTIDLDRGGTGNPDFYIAGPKQKNFGWNIDLSWDLGELIWIDDQTNIDVRSKLMVQLRDDLLNEVTKLYFERRRLQIEMLNASPKRQRQFLQNQLRIHELTAQIDALTGGYLSRQIKMLDLPYIIEEIHFADLNS